LSGRELTREMDIYHGDGKNGKSAFQTALQVVLGNLQTCLNQQDLQLFCRQVICNLLDTHD